MDAADLRGTLVVAGFARAPPMAPGVETFPEWLPRHVGRCHGVAGAVSGPGKLQPFRGQLGHRGRARSRGALRALERVAKQLHRPRWSGTDAARFQRRVVAGLGPRQPDRLVAPRRGLVSPRLHSGFIVVESRATP